MERTNLILNIHERNPEAALVRLVKDQWVVVGRYQSEFQHHETEVNLYEKLQQFLNEHDLSNHTVTAILPAHEVYFQLLEFPFADKKKIREILPMEIEHETRFSHEELTCLADTVIQLPEEERRNPEKEYAAPVFFMHNSYLDALRDILLSRQLYIKTIHCSAHFLFRTLPEAEADSNRQTFQIYLGNDECFLNIVHKNKLVRVVSFPHELSYILGLITHKGNLQRNSLVEVLLNPDSTLATLAEEDGQSISILLNQARQEIQALSCQINSSLRRHHFSPDRDILLRYALAEVLFTEDLPLKVKWHLDSRPLSAGLEQTAEEERPATLEVQATEAQTTEAIPSQDSETTLPQDPPESNTELPQEAVSAKVLDSSDETAPELAADQAKDKVEFWGILTVLLQKPLEILLEESLSFHKENAQWAQIQRFVKINRLPFALCALLVLTFLGGFGYKYFWELDLLHNQLEQARTQLKITLRSALPTAGSLEPSKALAQLKDNIAHEKRVIEQGKPFETRSYKNLRLLEELSEMDGIDGNFVVDRLEFSDERFTLSGVVSSYENLQQLKTGLNELEAFKGQEILESNRTTRDGIIYRLTINRQ